MEYRIEGLGNPSTEKPEDVTSHVQVVQLSNVTGMVVRRGDLSHEMTLSHEGCRIDCDNVNRV